MDIDAALESAGSFGRFQMKVVALCYLASFFSAMPVQQGIFINYSPLYRCRVSYCDDVNSTYDESFLNFSTPYDESFDRWEQCSYYHGVNTSPLPYTSTTPTPNALATVSTQTTVHAPQTSVHLPQTTILSPTNAVHSAQTSVHLSKMVTPSAQMMRTLAQFKVHGNKTNIFTQSGLSRYVQPVLTANMKGMSSSVAPTILTMRVPYAEATLGPDLGHCTPADVLPGDAAACDSGFVYQKEVFASSTVMEFELTCSRAVIPAFLSSSFMVGMMAGAVGIGHVGDRHGRKVGLMIAVVLMAGGGGVAAASGSLWMFMAMRFVTGVGSAGLFLNAVVMAVEYTVPAHRVGVGIMVEVPYALGSATVGVLAFFIRDDWRLLQLCCVVPTAVLLFMYWLLPESIRWLSATGQHDRVKAILQDIARTNNTALPTDSTTHGSTHASIHRSTNGNTRGNTHGNTHDNIHDNIHDNTHRINHGNSCNTTDGYINSIDDNIHGNTHINTHINTHGNTHRINHGNSCNTTNANINGINGNTHGNIKDNIQSNINRKINDNISANKCSNTHENINEIHSNINGNIENTQGNTQGNNYADNYVNNHGNNNVSNHGNNHITTSSPNFTQSDINSPTACTTICTTCTKLKLVYDCEETADKRRDDEALEKTKIQKNEERKVNKSALHLLRTPNLRKRCLIQYYLWASLSMVYYGLASNTANLEGDLFVNYVLMMLIEIPSYFFAWFLLDRFGRKGTLVLALLISGFSCLISGSLPQGMETAIISLSMVGKFGAAAAYGIIFVYASEILPTEYRSVGVGACSMSARIGGILAPLVSATGQLVYSGLPLLIFGGLTMIAVLLTLFLPETAGCILPDTLEDSEEFGSDQSILSFLCFDARKSNNKTDGNNLSISASKKHSSTDTVLPHSTAKDGEKHRIV